jgi:hypothetical protein
MKTSDLELAILKAVAVVRNDEWLSCSLGDLRNRLREVHLDAGNASFNGISDAAVSLAQEGYLQLGKREDGFRRVPFDLQKQFDEGFVSNFFGRGSFELKLTHKGRKHLEEGEQRTVQTERESGGASAVKNGEVQKPERESNELSASKRELLERNDAASGLDRRLEGLAQLARSYFDDALVSYEKSGNDPLFSFGSDAASAVRSKFELRGRELAANLRDLGLQMIEAASRSPIVPEADINDLKITVRRMSASLRFREYSHYGSYVVHEEDRVYGIQPESSQEINVTPEQAQALFSDGMTRLREALNDFIDPRAAVSVPKGAGRKMPRTAIVLNILVASPSDVGQERDVVTEVIHAWNAAHYRTTGIMLHAVRWETHSYPAAGDRPQAILNKQIVDSGDILIGIFGYRLGTPTGTAQSGTIEEIEEFREAGKYVALYFSTADIPRGADINQLKALEDYQRERQKDTLYRTFRSPGDLRLLVTQDLPKIVAEVSAGLEGAASAAGASQTPKDNVARVVIAPMNDDLSAKEIELLWNAVKDRRGEILHTLTYDGESLRTNGRQFLANADARTGAEWVASFGNLRNRGFIEPLSYGSDFFRVTGDGYRAADELEGFARWDAKSIVLRARNMNAPDDEVTLACKGIIAIPPRYFEDQIRADRPLQRSLKEPRTLLVDMIGSQPEVGWNPTEVEFLDGVSGQTLRFLVMGMDLLQPGSLKLPIVA